MALFSEVARQLAQVAAVAASKAAVRTGVALTDSDGHVQVQIGGQVWWVTDYTGRVKTGDAVTVLEQDNTARIDKLLREESAPVVPAGGVVMWFSDTIPTGWAKCDGSAYNTTDNPAVFAILGASTLPDMRDRFPRGASGSAAVKSTGGSTTITEANMPAHSHSIGNSGTDIANGTSPTVGEELLGNSTSRGWETGNAGSGSTYWQPYRAVHWIMRMG